MSELVENLRNIGNGMIGLSHDAQHLIDQRDEARQDRDEAIQERNEIKSAFLSGEACAWRLPRVITVDEVEVGQATAYLGVDGTWRIAVIDEGDGIELAGHTIVLLADAPEPEPTTQLPTEPGALIEVTEVSENVIAQSLHAELPILFSAYELGGKSQWDSIDGRWNLKPNDITSWRPMRVVPAED